MPCGSFAGNPGWGTSRYAIRGDRLLLPKHLKMIFKKTFIVFALTGLCYGLEGTNPDSLAALLHKAVENQYRGEFSADVLMVRDSFLRGMDSLRGRLEFNDDAGNRRVNLRGRDDAFEWWSKNFGQEQWWKDDKSNRIRRIPNRSFKKPAFNSLLSYEDLFKFPADYLLDFQTCLKYSETDSNYQFLFSMRSESRSRYGTANVTLTKRPLLLKRAEFFAPDGHKLKSLEITSYLREGEKYFPAGLRVFDGDSLASVRLALLRPKAETSVGPDKTLVSRKITLPQLPMMGLESAEDEGGQSEGDTEGVAADD